MSTTRRHHRDVAHGQAKPRVSPRASVDTMTLGIPRGRAPHRGGPRIDVPALPPMPMDAVERLLAKIAEIEHHRAHEKPVAPIVATARAANHWLRRVKARIRARALATFSAG
jgi:hypothetical protein